jgi:hypothetical protein
VTEGQQPVHPPSEPALPERVAQQTFPLSALWTRRSEFSTHASTHVRTSALAGLAVAWLFAGGTEGDLSTLTSAHKGLLLAAAVFAASLGADILQYFLGAAVFRWLARHYETRDNKVNTDLVAVPAWVPRVPAFFYNVKVILLFGGYAVLVYVFLESI